MTHLIVGHGRSGVWLQLGTKLGGKPSFENECDKGTISSVHHFEIEHIHVEWPYAERVKRWSSL